MGIKSKSTTNDQVAKREVHCSRRNAGKIQEMGDFLFTFLLGKWSIQAVNPSIDYCIVCSFFSDRETVVLGGELTWPKQSKSQENIASTEMSIFFSGIFFFTTTPLLTVM